MLNVRSSLNGSQAVMPLYLLIASIASGVFLYKSAMYFRMAERGSVPKAGSLLMICAAIVELTWALPCFVQCVLDFVFVIAKGRGDVACDIQGFYSVVSAIGSLLIGPLYAWFTLFCLINGSCERIGLMKRLCAACVISPVVLGLLMLLPGLRDHVGYANLGEGFCFWDMKAKPVAAILLILTSVFISVTIALYVKAMCSLGADTADKKAKRQTLLVLSFSYIGSVVVGPVASILTLSNQTFPPGLMTVGSLFGHAQALLNPFIYGILWRRYFLADYNYECKMPEKFDASVKATAVGA